MGNEKSKNQNKLMIFKLLKHQSRRRTTKNEKLRAKLRRVPYRNCNSRVYLKVFFLRRAFIK